MGRRCDPVDHTTEVPAQGRRATRVVGEAQHMGAPDLDSVGHYGVDSRELDRSGDSRVGLGEAAVWVRVSHYLSLSILVCDVAMGLISRV